MDAVKGGRSSSTSGGSGPSNTSRNDNDSGSSFDDGVWILVDNDDSDLKGMTMIIDRHTGDVVGISSRNSRNEDKPEIMPDLSNYPSLKLVDFHGQRFIKSINESIGTPTMLERLILSRMNFLQTLHPAIGNLHNLVELNLFDSCNIRELPADLSGLYSLKRLRMGGSSGNANKVLQTLPESLGSLTSLEELHLDKLKSLKALPSTMGKLQNLIRLSLRECKALRILPPSIVRCKNLVELNLLKCQSLQSLPDDIGVMSSLEEIILQKGKSIQEIPRSIGSLDHLSVLDLRATSIVTLPEELSGCVQLRILDLSRCPNLADLPPLIGELPQVDIDLTNTPSLQSVPPSLDRFLRNS